MSEPEAIVHFWLHDVGEGGWYAVDDAVDAEIRTRFLPAWEAALRGEREFWLNGPRGSLAYLILTDQFPRNLFRADARAFATDARARAGARAALEQGWDMGVKEPERVFFYMPFEHSEDAADQDLALRCLAERMPERGGGYHLHARAHAEIIRRFGRFPYRNAALGREGTAAEQAFLDAGGYGAIVRELQGGAAGQAGRLS
ncbi:DUF924 family protein [Albidovulum sp.]|uniref:DUF924 family protein n=1 Tax=Albidovulum sp. TaxID=1872424 RepID=UPI0039B95AAF